MTADLVAFLREQLDAEEQEARDTAAEWGTAWTVNEEMATVQSNTGADVVAEDAPLQYIARHDPARALPEIDAKREVVRLAERAYDYHETFMNGFAAAIEGALRLFAQAYVHHPDYRPEWAPDAR